MNLLTILMILGIFTLTIIFLAMGYLLLRIVGTFMSKVENVLVSRRMNKKMKTLFFTIILILLGVTLLPQDLLLLFLMTIFTVFLWIYALTCISPNKEYWRYILFKRPVPFIKWVFPKNKSNKSPEFIKIFDNVNQLYIYYKEQNFYQKINDSYVKIPFDSNLIDLKIRKNDFIKKNCNYSDCYECSEPHYILDSYKHTNYETDTILSNKFKTFCYKNNQTKKYIETI